MIRVGPSRNTAAGGIAAVLSCAGIVLCFLGFFLTIPGIALIASSQDSAFDDPFFDDVNEGQRTAGIVCLSLGLIMLTTGIICCICMCKNANEAMRSGQIQGAIISGGQQTVVAGPVVTGTVPMGQQFTGVQYQTTQYQQGAGYPAQAGYPTGTQYPPAAQYPPTTQYPAPATQYPPPATNPAFSYGTNDIPPQPAAPPPSYGDVVTQKQ